MGKQAKKKVKSESQASNQKRHNRATKHSRSKRRPVVWSKTKDKDGKVHQILYPNDAQWDWSRTHDAVTLEDGTAKLMMKKPRPVLHEPFDRLMDNWADNLRGYAEFNRAEIEREVISPGFFRYTVYFDEIDDWNPSQTKKNVLLTVTSHDNVNFSRTTTKRRRRKRT